MSDHEHLRPYGYAPGHYMGKCRTCGTVCIDLDKRASNCLPCAEALYAARAQPAQAGQVLTDEHLNDIFRESFKLIDSRMTPQQLQFARAIEQAVRAKCGIVGKEGA